MRKLFFKWTGLALTAILPALLIQGCAGMNAGLSSSMKAEQEYSEGLQLFKAGKYAQSHRHALSAWSVSPDADKYQSLLGWTYLKQGSVAEAERLFTAIYKKRGTDSIPAMQGLAWVEYTKGRFPEAKQWFEKQSGRAYDLKGNVDWMYFKPSDQDYVLSSISDADYGLGLTALAQAKYTDAEKHFLDALKNRNDFLGHGPLRAALGDVFYYQGNYPKALGYFREALNEKNDPATEVKVGWCFFYMGEIGKADTLFAQGLQARADHRPYLYGLVFTSQAQNRIPESKKHLEQLIRLDPYFGDVAAVHQLIEKNNWKILYKEFAASYSERGEFARAHAKLSKYLPTAKNDCEARIMDAWCEVYLNLKAALEKFDKLSRQRSCPGTDPLLGKGVALLYLGRLDEADASFKQVIAKDPHNTRAKVARGAVAFLKKDYRKAISIYTADIDQLPKQVLYFSWPSHALNNLGWSYIYTGRYQEALNTFKLLQAYHPTPFYPQVTDGLGWAYLHLGSKDEAEKNFRQSLSIAPQDPTALDGLARISQAKPQK